MTVTRIPASAKAKSSRGCDPVVSRRYAWVKRDLADRSKSEPMIKKVHAHVYKPYLGPFKNPLEDLKSFLERLLRLGLQ